MSSQFQPGDPVVYRKHKHSLHPGRRARDVSPAPYGDEYSYVVDKFWRVVAVLPDNMLIVRSRRGKEHTIAATDPALRRARWWERLFLRRRFPASLATPPSPTDSQQGSTSGEREP